MSREVDETNGTSRSSSGVHTSSGAPTRTSAQEATRRQVPSEQPPRDVLSWVASLHRVLARNRLRAQWENAFGELEAAFLRGRRPAVLDGPMIGVPLALRDSDPFQTFAHRSGSRSAVARLDVMATAWNAALADTGVWMGKTFEPVSKDTIAAVCRNDPVITGRYDAATCRTGRNFFRRAGGNFLHRLAVPVLQRAWRLKPRPTDPSAPGFLGELSWANLEKERAVPYDWTGGLFIAQPGSSVLPELSGKEVYQLNYRWPGLHNRFPQTLLVDELVQISDGVYLGQLVMATMHYEVGRLHLPLPGRDRELTIGEPYCPSAYRDGRDYGYQRNGFFVLADTSLAEEVYSDGVFPHLRPRPGESGFEFPA